MTPAERFWPKVDRRDAEGCWPWLAARTGGYGILSVGGRNTRAHRFAYELLVGPIPPGLTIDHLCRNRGCVNPAHLEPVTNAENHHRARWTHCKHGHEFTPENIYPMPRGGRECRTCKRRLHTRTFLACVETEDGRHRWKDPVWGRRRCMSCGKLRSEVEVLRAALEGSP